MAVSLLKTKDTEQTFRFPLGGVNVSSAFARQPNVPVDQSIGWYARTTPEAINVRAYDASGKARGGSRAGLSRYINKRLPGSIMSLGVVVGVGGAVQSSSSGRLVQLVVVANGNIRVLSAGADSFVTPTNGDSALISTGVCFSAQNAGKLFFADGTNWKYFDPSDNTVHAWAATDGTLPTDSDSNKPRLIATWQGSTMLSGLPKDPQNWFKTAIGNPFDFNYVPAVSTATQAVIGNNSPAGLIGDVVTALVPISDDVFIFGMDHSISALQGNPADGGRLIEVSGSIGFAWGKAWCKGSDGNIYFFSNQCGIFKMDPLSATPQIIRISQQIDPLLATINTGANTITMEWDHRAQGFHVHITRTAGPYKAVHLFYEARMNAWFKVRYTNPMHNPLCMTVFDGNEATDRVVLIGSWDGYVRFMDPAATTDDGVPIESKVLIGPLLTNNGDQIMQTEMLPVFAEGGGTVDYDVLVGNSAEQALASDSALHGTFTPGRNHTVPVMRSGYAIYNQISANAPWAMESIHVGLRGLGPVLRKGA